MDISTAIFVEPHNLAGVVDTKGFGFDGVGEINGREAVLVQHKAMDNSANHTASLKKLKVLVQ